MSTPPMIRISSCLASQWNGKIVDRLLNNLTPVSGPLLVRPKSSEEALPLLKQGFETGREASDREMIFVFGWEIGYMLVIDASEPDAAAALPYLTECLAVVTDNEERQYQILEFVALCLLYLEKQGELAHLADLKSHLDVIRNGVGKGKASRGHRLHRYPP